jgi:primosomal protein N' (replication factor Y)
MRGLQQSAPGVVRVALPLPIDSLFDYAVPEAFAPAAQPGVRARVRFGARTLVGVIAEYGEATARGRGPALRAIEAILDEAPMLSAELLSVLRGEAERVFCPLGIALACALPAGSAPRQAERVAATPRGLEALRAGAVRGAHRSLLEALARCPAAPAAVARRGAAQATLLRELLRDGLVARTRETLGPSARLRSERVAELAPGADAEALASGIETRAPAQAAVLRALATGARPVATLPGGAARAGAALRALAARGLVRIGSRERPREILPAAPAGDRPPQLTAEQASAFAPVRAAVEASRAERFLLHGVTGSGKTEVYLRAVSAALALGRSALVLVPEITLTHQIVARLRARFGEQVAILHSGLRPGERLEQWQKLRRGETPIAVGARSALFAPLEKLGVLVVDEEHDSAYKNEEGFRYHARDLGARRAAAAGCPLVLGSATPSLETLHACQRGELTRLALPHRIGGRPLPAVEVVDLGAARAAAPRGRKQILSPPLQRALRETLAEGGQSILFLNRRGFSTQVLCFDCGHAERCRHCDIALVYHAADDCLRCHYCDYRIAPPEACTKCGAVDTALLGVGTQRVEEELRAVLPGARVARLDRDTATRKGFTERVLEQLAAGGLDVLVGTQIVAKGHDFPGVRLVGVVAADLGLHLPDFRAAERTVQLLTQVAGRAGRGQAPGRVILQTWLPEHPAILAVRDHDDAAFQRAELAQREALGYPPFGQLLHALVSAPEAGDAERGARALADVLREAVPAARDAQGPLEILGPSPAPIARLRDRHRYMLLVKTRDAALHRAAGRALARAIERVAPPLRAALDANPVNLQ